MNHHYMNHSKNENVKYTYIYIIYENEDEKISTDYIAALCACCVKFPFVSTHLHTDNISLPIQCISLLSFIFRWMVYTVHNTYMMIHISRFISIPFHGNGVWIASGPNKYTGKMNVSFNMDKDYEILLLANE